MPAGEQGNPSGLADSMFRNLTDPSVAVVLATKDLSRHLVPDVLVSGCGGVLASCSLISLFWAVEGADCGAGRVRSRGGPAA